MSRRRSPSSAQGDDDLTPPRGNPVRDAREPDRSSDDRRYDDASDDEWNEPNYLVRRALVVAVVVLAVAVVAVVASRFIGDGDGGGSSAEGADWNTTVVLTSDEIRLLDRETGDAVATFESTIDLLDAQSLVATDVLVTLTDDGSIQLVDLNDGTSRRGRTGADETLLASPDDPSIALAGPDAGGDLTIIDAERREIFGVADVIGLDDPLIFSTDARVNASGSHVAVPVPTAFQSFVIDVVAETSAAYSGRVIAISDELVVTEQPAGSESEIEFHRLDGERLASVDVPAPRASLLTESGSLVLVAADGSVRTVASDGSVDDVDPIVDDEGAPLTVTGGFPAFGGTRLVVTADDSVVVLDEGGSTLGSAVGEATAPASAVRCVIVGSGTSARPSTVLDLEDGSVLTMIDRGVPATSSVDGCTVALIGGTGNLLTDGEVIGVDGRSVAEVAPDGTAVIVSDGRTTDLVRIGDDDDRIEIADEPVVVRFGDRT